MALFNKKFSGIRAAVMEKLNPIIEKAEADYDDAKKNADNLYNAGVQSLGEIRAHQKETAFYDIVNRVTNKE